MKKKSEGVLSHTSTSYLGKCKGVPVCISEKWGELRRTNRGEAVSGSGGGGLALNQK